ncbi:glycosyltransferase family 2 protein [Colwellia hornerae]|uniref:Glycosyltransferase n=1 Tax=Colwellia hornerae TaxID=89402 RepID=A0A5C6QAU0_9GAMM|nr:glycosyltransferase [Colwellia hornerae]TWX51079.1 glycosyltransferase [Colwellia hornerae]TWX56757.1 glycosyltransferase [Colwellia hornerae]TWX65727.1 glycosyltransferase [Colwellia hornerae]
MLISTVILSYNSVEPIQRCLDELISSLAKFDEESEIFIVDNGSKDGSVELIKQYENKYQELQPALIKPIFFSENTGTTYSRNAALKRAQGKFTLVLDSDAYVNYNALKSLIAYLEDHHDVGMAVPRLAYNSGNFQLSCDVFPTLIHKLKRFLFLKKIESKPHELQATNIPTNVDYAISACWLLTKDAVDKIGLFDENIFYSPEDVDYCLRAWECGYKITYIPGAEVIHDAQELSRGFKLSMFHFSHLKGLFYLMNKHKYFWGLTNLYKRLNRFS